MSATVQFRQWLIKARTKGKMTYGQLAEKSGVSTATLHGLEHGDGSCGIDTAEKIAKAFDVSLESIFRVRTKPTVVFPSSDYTPDSDC